MAEHRGGSGNFAENREKASEAAVKVANIAAEILKTIRNVLLKQVKKAAKTAVAEINPTNRRHPFFYNF